MTMKLKWWIAYWAACLVLGFGGTMLVSKVVNSHELRLHGATDDQVARIEQFFKDGDAIDHTMCRRNPMYEALVCPVVVLRGTDEAYAIGPPRSNLPKPKAKRSVRRGLARIGRGGPRR